MREAVRTPDTLRALAARPEGVLVAVVGTSMEPGLPMGSHARVHACAYLWPGQGVLFEAGGTAVLHRTVLEVPGFGWVFQVGDAGGDVGVVHRERVIGRADIPWRMPAAGAFAQAAGAMATTLARIVARGDWRRPFRAAR